MSKSGSPQGELRLETVASSRTSVARSGIQFVFGGGNWVPASGAIAASPQELVRDIALGESDAKVTAIRALGSSGDTAALTLLQALLDGNVQTVNDKEVLLIKAGSATELGTGKAISPLPA